MYRSALLLLGALTGICPSASAVVTVTPSTGASVTQVSPGVWDVVLTIPAASSASRIYVVRGAATDRIRNCFVDSQSSLFTFVDILGPTPGTAIGSLDQFNIGLSTGGVFLRELRTVGNVGIIRTNVIQRAFVGGNVVNNIEIVDSASLVSERIEELNVTGSLLASVTAEAGYLQKIAVGGTIGNTTFTRTISAPDRIENIQAAAIFANISATGTTAGTGLIRRIETTSGSFTGSLTAREITTGALGTGTPGVAIVGGTLNAPVTIETGFPTGATINVPANGLTSQIIINNANNAANTWAGIVSVGASSLTAANYPIANSILGNGSVGRVPFNVHDASSSPVNNAPSVPATDITNNAFMRRSPSATHRNIVIEFDGPIQSLASVPVNVDYVIEACSMPGGVMTFNMNNRCAFSISGRRLTITPKLVGGTAEFYLASGRYKVSPNGSNLTCSNVPGSPSVANFEYFFDLWPDCDGDGLRTAQSGGGFEGFCGFTGFCDPIDFNNNGVFPEDQDVIDFYSVLAGGPCSSNNICNDIDFNNNGVFPEDEDVQAFFDVLAGGCVYCFR